MRALRRLALITFAICLGAGFTAPVLPLHAARLGGSYRDLGFMSTALGFAFAALALPAGRLADRLGRRALLVCAAAACTIAAGGYLVAPGTRWLIAARAVEGAGWAAFWPAMEAFAADAAPPGGAGKALGTVYAAYAAAYLAGSGSGGWIGEQFGLTSNFALYVITALGSLLLIGWPLPQRTAGHLRPHEGVGTQAGTAARAAPETAARGGLAGRAPLLGYAAGFVYTFYLAVVLTFLPSLVGELGGGPAAAGAGLSLYWLGRIIASPIGGALSDRVGRKGVLVAGFGLSVLAAAAIIARPGPVSVAGGMVAIGLTAGVAAPASIALISDHVSERLRGAAMGVFEFGCNAGFLTAGLVGGLAAERAGLLAPYWIAAALAVAIALALALGLKAPAARGSVELAAAPQSVGR